MSNVLFAILLIVVVVFVVVFVVQWAFNTFFGPFGVQAITPIQAFALTLLLAALRGNASASKS